MAIPYNVARVITYFQRKIDAYDLVCEIVDHECVVTKQKPYSFIGVLIPPTDKDLQLFDEGEIANGAMVLYVKDTIKLNMCDSISTVTPGQKQTIVLFDGDEYRVKSYSNRSSDGLHRKYGVVRYIPERSNGNY